jgi:microcystin-dependent protein
MSEPFLAEIIMFAGNFAPRGWAFCQGQILSIAQNTALFSLLGTTYGGNGQTTFALPDLRGRVPVGTGQGPGLPSVNLGEVSGEPTHTLIISEMPAHNHTTQTVTNASGGAGDSGAPTNNFPAASANRDSIYASSSDGTHLNPNAVQVTVGIAGGSQPHNNMQPYLGMNYIIAIAGIFPSRN